MPAIAAVMDYPVQTRDEYICPITSNGLAAGPTPHHAVVAALTEVLERRDALELAQLLAGPPPRCAAASRRERAPPRRALPASKRRALPGRSVSVARSLYRRDGSGTATSSTRSACASASWRMVGCRRRLARWRITSSLVPNQALAEPTAWRRRTDRRDLRARGRRSSRTSRRAFAEDVEASAGQDTRHARRHALASTAGPAASRARTHAAAGLRPTFDRMTKPRCPALLGKLAEPLSAVALTTVTTLGCAPAIKPSPASRAPGPTLRAFYAIPPVARIEASRAALVLVELVVTKPTGGAFTRTRVGRSEGP